MPAYNPPQQVLFSPVSNYYQGKAIRTQQAMAEKELEMVDKNYDLNKRQVEVQEGRLEFDAEKLYAASMAKLGEEKTKALGDAASEFSYSVDNGVDLEVAQEKYQGDLVSIFGKEQAERMFSEKYDRDGDGMLNEQEVEMIRSFATVHGYDPKDAAGSTTVLSLQEKIDMGMAPDWAKASVVERDETGNISVTSQPTGMTETDAQSRQLTDDNVTNRKVQEANHSARNLVDLTNRVASQIDAIPQGGLGLTGKGVRGLDDVGSELAGIFEIIGGVEYVDGKVVETGTLLDPSLYTWSGPMANASAAVKSNYVTLAYLKAKTLDPGGRLAKDDVALAMQSLGGDWASKGKMLTALNETKWQALNGLKNYYKSLDQPDAFPEDLQNMLSELEPSTFSDQKIVINSSDDAAFAELPSGTTFFDETGKKWIKP